MIATPNPWTDRFRGLDDLDEIKSRVALRVAPLLGLGALPAEEACDRIKEALSETFYPTKRVCEILREIVQCAASHAARSYPNCKAHLSKMYLEQLDSKPYVPILLTGPAGMGKTQLRMAIERLFPASSFIQPHAGHGSIPLVSIRSITVRGRSSVGSLMKLLVDPDRLSPKLSEPELIDASARWQSTCGVCCIVVDELQFLTLGSTANTLLAQVLLGLSYVGVPYVAVINYSAGHRLARRRAEDRQRLLGRPVILLPDAPDSPDWLAILQEYQLAVPDVYEFDLGLCAAELWSLSAGLKRELVKLLVLAYRQARRMGQTTVKMIDVQRAYLSAEFAAPRDDIEALIMCGFDSLTLRIDLRCPFPIAKRESDVYAQSLQAARDQRVAEAARDASCTQKERKSKEFLEKVLNSPTTKAIAGVDVSLPRAKRMKPTAVDLKAAGEQFRRRSAT